MFATKRTAASILVLLTAAVSYAADQTAPFVPRHESLTLSMFSETGAPGHSERQERYYFADGSNVSTIPDLGFYSVSDTAKRAMFVFDSRTGLLAEMPFPPGRNSRDTTPLLADCAKNIFVPSEGWLDPKISPGPKLFGLETQVIVAHFSSARPVERTEYTVAPKLGCITLVQQDVHTNGIVRWRLAVERLELGEPDHALRAPPAGARKVSIDEWRKAHQTPSSSPAAPAPR